MNQSGKKAWITRVINTYISTGRSIKQLKMNTVVIRIVPMSNSILFSKNGFFDKLSSKRVSDYIVRNSLYTEFLTQFGGKNVVAVK